MDGQLIGGRYKRNGLHVEVFLKVVVRRNPLNGLSFSSMPGSLLVQREMIQSKGTMDS